MGREAVTGLLTCERWKQTRQEHPGWRTRRHRTKVSRDRLQGEDTRMRRQSSLLGSLRTGLAGKALTRSVVGGVLRNSPAETDLHIMARNQVPSPISRDRRQRVLHSRAISDGVIDGAEVSPRYAEFEKGDSDALIRRWLRPERFYRGEDLQNKERFLKGVATQTGGLVIVRRDLSPRNEVPVAHIRLDNAVSTGPSESTRYLTVSEETAGYRDFDVHPMAQPGLLEGGGDVWLAMEGSLKGDAIQSTGRCAVSIRSIWFWHEGRVTGTRGVRSSWSEHVPYLRHAGRVFLVPDSDWATNDHVRLAAFRLGRSLLAEKVRVELWVPPSAEHVKSFMEQQRARQTNQRVRSYLKRSKVGVDDYLAAGGELDEDGALPVHPPELQAKVTKSQKHLLRLLAEEYGWWGLVRTEKLAARLDVDPRTVRRAWRSLEDQHILRYLQGLPYETSDGYYRPEAAFYRETAWNRAFGSFDS
jgi:hypothetical protein